MLLNLPGRYLCNLIMKSTAETPCKRSLPYTHSQEEIIRNLNVSERAFGSGELNRRVLRSLHSLYVRVGRVLLPDGGQGEAGPVDRVEILPSQLVPHRCIGIQRQWICPASGAICVCVCTCLRLKRANENTRRWWRRRLTRVRH